MSSLAPRAILPLPGDGFVEVRDRYGHLWMFYNPVTQEIRRTEKKRGRMVELRLKVDDLLAQTDPARPIEVRSRIVD